MMPRLSMCLLLALTLALCAASAPVLAQDDPPSEPAQADTTSSAAPASYVYGAAAPVTPAGMARVRRRIAKIGARGAAQRVVYPVIVIVPQVQGVVYPTPYGAPLLTQPTPAQPGMRFARDPSRAEQPPATAPSVAQVEHVLLTTGFFSTTDVVFEFDRSRLLPASRAVLDVVGEVLVRQPALRVEVAGHTDSAGPAPYNLRLSEARAEAVRSYLLGRFTLAPGRIETRGYGESQPVASNATAIGRALNRRVEFRVLGPVATRQTP